MKKLRYLVDFKDSRHMMWQKQYKNLHVSASERRVRVTTPFPFTLFMGWASTKLRLKLDRCWFVSLADFSFGSWGLHIWQISKMALASASLMSTPLFSTTPVSAPRDGLPTSLKSRELTLPRSQQRSHLTTSLHLQGLLASLPQGSTMRMMKAEWSPSEEAPRQ